MNDKQKAAALKAMRERRIEAIRERARRDTAIRLLDEKGSVTAEEVEAAIAAVEIDEMALADQMAAKAAAAAVKEHEELDKARDAVAKAEAKIAKFEELTRSARESLDEARGEVTVLEQRVADAEELAEYAAELGNADAAPPPTITSAKAGIAAADGKANA